MAVTEFVKNGQQALGAVRRQRDGVVDRIEKPAQDDLLCAPGAVTFAKLFYGDGFVAMGIRCGERSKDGVD